VCFLIDRVGRRIPLLVGATIQATAMLVLGLFVGIADPVANPHGRGVHGGGIFAIISIYMYAVGWAMGHSIACYVVAAEIFPTRIRAVAMAMCLFFNW
jgi:MFS family permease